MTNLYELATRFQMLLDQEELTDEENTEINAMTSDIEDACIYRAKYLRNKQSELEAVKEAIKNMQERAKALESRIERQESWLASRMLQTGIVKITKSPLFILQTKRCPPAVYVDDETLIPENYFRTKVTETKSLDKLLIKSTIDAGTFIPGCQLISKLKIEIK